MVILLNSVDEKIMDHAISYSLNLGRAFAARGKKPKIEVVANGAE